MHRHNVGLDFVQGVRAYLPDCIVDCVQVFNIERRIGQGCLHGCGEQAHPGVIPHKGLHSRGWRDGTTTWGSLTKACRAEGALSSCVIEVSYDHVMRAWTSGSSAQRGRGCRQWPSKARLVQDTAPTTCLPCFWSWLIRLSSSTSEAEKLLPTSMKVGKLPCTA